MKIKTLLGLATIGGLFYAHRKRGGEMTLASIKDSFGALRDAAMKKLKTLDAAQVPNAGARSYDANNELH